MKHLRDSLQRPAGQVLLATLLFCFIFIVLFMGLFKAGTAYISKERTRRATDLTALSAGAVYANGLEWVRYSNVVDMGLTTVDVGIILMRISPMLVTLPEGAPAIVAAAIEADPKLREKIGQRIQKYLFGVGMSAPGAYPLLIHTMAHETADSNQLSDSLVEPVHLYNLESASLQDVMVPNMALRFRTAADLLPEPSHCSYSFIHDGEKTCFSSDEVEPAGNPKNPRQMQVKQDGRKYGGWWVHKETDDGGPSELDKSPLSKIGGTKVLGLLKDLLKRIILDVTDRDEPACHTYTLLGTYNVKINGQTRAFRQVSEVRVEADGLAAWDITNPIDTYLQKVDLGNLPLLRQVPVLNGVLDKFGDYL